MVRHCVDKGIPVIPGTANPSDMEAALELGLSTVKFFPAEQAGGLAYIKAVAAPYAALRFVPTGGISAANIGAYTQFPKTLTCGGSWMVPAEHINAGHFDKITQLCKEAVSAMLGFSVVHFGINTQNETEMRASAARFTSIFGFPQRETSLSLFSSELIEVMSAKGRGTNGHIAVATNSVLKAKFHLERQSIAFDESSASTDPAGNLRLIYLKEEIAGFAVHLLQAALR